MHGVFACVHRQATEDLLMQHYAELKERPFFPKLVKYMSSGPVVPMVCLMFSIVSTTYMGHKEVTAYGRTHMHTHIHINDTKLM